MEKRPKKPINTGEWLNTYADMVTLILCFFVLLYSMSSIDAMKWENFVKSMNPDVVSSMPAIQTGPVVGGENTEAVSFEDIYALIQQVIEENQLQDQMEAKEGDGFALVVFHDSVLFDGDSYALRPGAMTVLDNFAGVIDIMSNEIEEIRILGHTTQARPTLPNTPEGDRFLASSRATQVAVYLQKKGIIEAKKIIPIGLGQHYPISPFDTEDHRAKNRRVEILISKAGYVVATLEEAYSDVGIEIVK